MLLHQNEEFVVDKTKIGDKQSDEHFYFYCSSWRDEKSAKLWVVESIRTWLLQKERNHSGKLRYRGTEGTASGCLYKDPWIAGQYCYVDIEIL